MKKLIISPFSRKLRNNKPNPKDYPYWQELILLLKDFTIIQVGVSSEKKLAGVDSFAFDLSLESLKEVLLKTNIWISVDNFWQHFAWYHGKRGIALFGPSDPAIFGHKENKNLYRDKKYFRPNQFDMWENCPLNNEAFIKPKTVYQYVLSELQK